MVVATVEAVANRDLGRRFVKASAVWDLVAVAPLALPFTAGHSLALLNWIGSLLGLYGEIPAPDPAHLLFANMAGLCGLIWIAYRLFAYHSSFVLAEFWVRAGFALLLGYYAVDRSISGVIDVFALTELAWAVVLGWAYLRERPYER